MEEAGVAVAEEAIPANWAPTADSNCVHRPRLITGGHCAQQPTADSETAKRPTNCGLALWKRKQKRPSCWLPLEVEAFDAAADGMTMQMTTCWD